MLTLITDLEELVERSTDPDERSMLLASLAWEICRVDTVRAVALADEIRLLAQQREQPPLAAIARVIELSCAFYRGETGAPAREAGELETILEKQAEWRAHLLNVLALDMMAVGDNMGALEVCQRGLALYENAGNRRGVAAILSHMGLASRGTGDYAGALKFHYQALEIREELDDRKGIADALNNLCIVYKAMGDYTRAVELGGRGLAIYEEIDYRAGVGNALANLGILHYQTGDYMAALTHYGRASAIYEQMGDRNGVGSTLSNIGNVHLALCDYPTALERYHQAIAIFDEIGNHLRSARVLIAVGVVYQHLGESELALETQRRALAILEEWNDPEAASMALNHIGNHLMRAGDHAGAFAQFTRALQIKQQIGDRKGIAATHNNLGLLATTGGDSLAAIEHFLRALDINETIGYPAGIALTLVNLGTARTETGEIDDAIATLRKALDLSDTLGLKSNSAHAHRSLVTACERAGDFAQALAHLREEIRINSEIQSEETRKQIHQAEARKQIEIERLRNTELAEALHQLKAAQAQLVQSEKMASLGQLTAGLAHEINNPINFVSASLRPLLRNHLHLCHVLGEVLDLLPSGEGTRIREEEEIDDTIDEQRQLIASIEDGARRTAGIVAGLRSFSRLDEGGLKHVDLHEGLEVALTILSGSISAGIELKRDYGELPEVECYPGEINQVFMNILTNAIKAIDGAGDVSIRSEAIDDEVVISISDTGVGMTPEIEQKIFEPFFTTRDVGQGRGLGLSIAWGIVEKHGGRIDVTSRAGEGSTFTIRLPITGGTESKSTGDS